MKKNISFILLNALFGMLSANAGVDCIALSVSVKNSVAAEKSKALEIVASEVSAAPACACEIVKAAIEGAGADTQTVAAIVQAAATAAPEQMRLVSQCAVAVAPDALGAVQAVLSKLDPNLGESAPASQSAKDSKAPVGEVAAMPNPLDFPGQGPVGPTKGGPGGSPVFPVTPPVIIAPPVSRVNPG
jgi:hypothetical protein